MLIEFEIQAGGLSPMRPGDQTESVMHEFGELGLAKGPGRDQLIASLQSFRGRLPDDFRFDRDDAHER